MSAPHTDEEIIQLHRRLYELCDKPPMTPNYNEICNWQRFLFEMRNLEDAGDLSGRFGSPNHIGLAQEWDNCRAGYVAYHKSKQADWWQRKAYGTNGGRRLQQNRFAGRKTARSTPFDIDGPLDEKQADDRLMTMREHARKKDIDGPKKPRREREAATVIVEQADLIPAPKKPTTFATVAAAVGYDAADEDEPMPF